MKERRIIWYIFTAFLIVIFISIVSLAIFLNWSFDRFFVAKVQSDLSSYAALSTRLIEDAVRTGLPEEGIRNLVRSISQDVRCRVTLIDASGKVIADSELQPYSLERLENHLQRPEVQEALAKGEGFAYRYSTTFAEKMAYAARILKDENGQTIGIIRFSLSTEGISLFKRTMTIMLVTGGIISFIIALIIATVLSFYILNPIRKVSTVAEDIQREERIAKFPRVRIKEIGQMVEALNGMIEKLDAKVREAEKQRREMEAVISSVSEGIVAINPEGEVVLWNDTASEFLNVSNDGMKGKKLIDVCRQPELYDVLHQTIEQRTAVQRDIYVSETNKSFKLVSVPIRYPAEEHNAGAVAVLFDITELKRYDELRKEFVANVSHELKTPLTTIKGYIETLRDGAIHDRGNAHRFLDVISTQADRLSLLIEDLLALSKLERQAEKLEYTDVHLRRLVEEVILSLTPQIQARSHTVKNLISEDLPSMRADKKKIAQALSNLIDNAIKFTPDSGIITISSSIDDGRSTKISISDTGIGIPPEDQKRIFERFYRVDKDRSRELGGTGLGLSIVKHIVDAHGGTVGVISTPGKGSTFWFTIPPSERSRGSNS